MIDVAKIRKDFPILEQKVYGKPLIYLDNTATTQTPRAVVDAIVHAYYNAKANVHRGTFHLAQMATEAMEATRRRVARFFNAPAASDIIFTRGTTESINLVASSYGQLIPEGSEIILTVMEHHANIVPWQLLQYRKPLTIKVVPIRHDGSLDMEAYRRLLTDRTAMVSVCHVSNVLGTVNPIKEIIATAHSRGVPVLIDGAQAVSHMRIDMQDLDADFYAFSSHKMYGPTGIGVLYGRHGLLEKMPPYQGGGEMIGHVSFEKTTFAELPYKFEAGTPDFVDIAALNQGIDFIESVGIKNINAHEQDLLSYATEQMMQIPGMRIFGTAPGKEAIISFLIGNAHHFDTGTLLDRLGVAVRTGHHCAQPLMHALGIEGCVRASFAAYNTREEVDQFITAIHRILPLLG